MIKYDCCGELRPGEREQEEFVNTDLFPDILNYALEIII